MQRRDLSKVLLGTAAGSMILSGAAQAQTCTAPCYPPTSDETGITPILTQYEVGDVRRYGADPSGTNDSTGAFNKALLALGTCFAVDGKYRIDGTVTVADYQSLRLSHEAQLVRMASHSTQTTPVVHIRGVHALVDGGVIESENDSPNGVVCCGALNINTSAWQSLYWVFKNCRVFTKHYGGATANPYPGDSQGVGVYIASSEPVLGSAYTNYFGTIQNIQIENATTAFLLTDLCNAHSFVNCTARGIYWYGFRLHGAYANSFSGGFLEVPHRNGVIGIWLAHKLVPSSPTSVFTMRNHFQGITMELTGSDDIGLHIGNPETTNNFVQFAWNGIGPAVNDVTNANTIINDIGGARFNNVRVSAPTPTGTGTQLSFGNTTATNVGGAGGAAPLPVTPLGYLVVDYGGQKIKVPYYRA